MDVKRSKGVTFWGWVFIISGILGILKAQNPRQAIQFYGVAIFFVGLILSAVALGCGIFILKLNERARIIAIISCLLGVLLIPVYLKPIVKQLSSEDFYKQQKQRIVEQMKPEYQQEALENLEKAREVNKTGLPILIVVLSGVPFLLFELIPIYFFTRPKVMEQFR